MEIKSDQAIMILAKSIENHPSLTSINLSYNDITLRGCKLLRDAVASSSFLTLNLEGNSGEKKQIGVQITGGLRPTNPLS